MKRFLDNICITCILYNLDAEKIECTVDIKACGFLHGKKAENVVFLFLTSELTAFI